VTKIKLIQDDITQVEADAIVNAANSSLLGGGGVDGAIHRVAGKELLEACRLLNGCETGQAKITAGFLLKAKFVIHTVGPVYHAMSPSIASQLLHDAYKNSLALAKNNECRSIVFPNISTGVYGFPKVEAAQIAIKTVKDFIKTNTKILEEIIFCCFDDENYSNYQKFLSAESNN